MTIAILPARLANQIAAGEVVERPASVIKELIENSLDAGATIINIDVDKGGVKRIRIHDNGVGIGKDELTLALSRHATSKIKDLADLEAISSLGFRGEALASISSVARLTLTSKPKKQATAWQASAEGRDMAVTIKPAAHPDGTSLEVVDLFFNTPARRKFLRTEKTEFNHIDEVIKRIALACFDVSFSLTHNGKLIRQYRAATTSAQKAKRVAQVCGQKFIDNAIVVHCQHDNMIFSGWLAKPSFARNQNDLCYSYVNGRMMRDKLINHAIRQAYADLLPPDTYPAFVLFLSLENRDVDVNVHPSKHEVRFHQSRYVHDFIYTVCHKALLENNPVENFSEKQSSARVQSKTEHDNVHYVRPEYVKPLTSLFQPQINETGYQSKTAISQDGIANYQQLMTPTDVASEQGNDTSYVEPVNINVDKEIPTHSTDFFLAIAQEKYGIFKWKNQLQALSLPVLAQSVNKINITQLWQPSEIKTTVGLVSQPLLLPIALKLSKQQLHTIQNWQATLVLAGVIVNIQNNPTRVQIRQFPALLREQDVSTSFMDIIDDLSTARQDANNNEDLIITTIARIMADKKYSEEQANILWQTAKKALSDEKIDAILLKSVPVDLTSTIEQLISVTP